MARNKSLILFFLIFLLNIQVVNAGKVCKAFRSYIDLIFNKNIAPKEAYGIQKRISNLIGPDVNTTVPLVDLVLDLSEVQRSAKELLSL